jgi:SAM-dependent methyltransferase
MKTNEIRQVVQTRYGKFAVAAGRTVASCCSKPASKACCALEQGLYSGSELSSVPEIARNLSRGCGNPTGFANLQAGEVIVDFGCGGGIDVILAARKVGGRGKVYGVDFTPEMIERAKEAVAQAGLADSAIEFREASLDDTALPDALADVVISNCVINLTPDKDAVYREAFRILKPGGRLAISDILLTGPIDAELRERLQSMWAGCTGGAPPEGDYWETVNNAGFTEVKIVARHLLSDPELNEMAHCPGEEYTPSPAANDLDRLSGKVESVKFTAIKPSLGFVV